MNFASRETVGPRGELHFCRDFDLSRRYAALLFAEMRLCTHRMHGDVNRMTWGGLGSGVA